MPDPFHPRFPDVDVAVRVVGACKSFGALKALDDVSLDIRGGEFFGLLGPNGAGKTTLIGALAGLVRPDRGSLSVMGADVQQDYRRARRLLGVVPQELVFDSFFTVRETLRIQSGYFGIAHNDPWIDELLYHLDLEAKADTNMRWLSGGMKRRVLVAQALVHRPPVIVLDEPTAGVDVELRQGLWKFIRRLNGEGHTIILTTHYLEEAQNLCQRIAVLKQGRIIALDTTAALLERFSGHVLSLRLAPGIRLPDVLAARARDDDGVWTIGLARLAEVEPILACLREAGCGIEDMRLAEPDLEEAFVQMTRGEGN